MARDSRGGARVGKVFIAISWIAVAVFAVAFVASTLDEDEVRQYPQPHFNALSKSYQFFRAQHVHPFYLFWFPLDLAQRTSGANEVCSVGEHGFRGPGPEEAGDRKLAFLLGGSSAFGDYASSNDATITGYLNSMQEQYFFVNAGVPSWNTTQELSRVALELLDFDPALILTYDGANDAALAARWFSRWRDYPPGTPESFDKLQRQVDRLRFKPGMADRLRSSLERLFRSKRERRSPGEVPEELLDSSVNRYVQNLRAIGDLARARGARHIAIFQPVTWLHEHVPAGWPEDERSVVLERFHASVMAGPAAEIELIDFGALFDPLFERVPVFDKQGAADIAAGVTFVDAVHTHNEGNRLIAEAIARLL